MGETREMQALALLFLLGCAGATVPVPVLPPIHDRAIVFGQRVGPVSLGMTEEQLFAAVGEVAATSYGGNRAGYRYAKLALNVVIDTGRVVSIGPTDGTYATAAGVRVGASEATLQASAPPAAATQRHGTTATYCYADHTLVTVGATATPVCAAGTVCDIVLGGCTPP